jgi:hypothetical protein
MIRARFPSALHHKDTRQQSAHLPKNVCTRSSLSVNIYIGLIQAFGLPATIVLDTTAKYRSGADEDSLIPASFSRRLRFSNNGYLITDRSPMFHFIKKTVLLLSPTLMFATTPAVAAVIDYDSGLAFDTGRASIFQQKLASDFSFSRLLMPAGLDDENVYLPQRSSLTYTDVLFSKKDLFCGAGVPGRKVFPDLETQTLEFSPASANTVSVASLTTTDFSANNAENSNITHLPLLGPIPEFSIKWLLVGVLVALAGLSRGTRGLHEGV